ncbi:MAG TPA: response regulator, partial [Terriglobia bacterium]|nr:response regulator [Terriglobia bacterium]
DTGRTRTRLTSVPCHLGLQRSPSGPDRPARANHLRRQRMKHMIAVAVLDPKDPVTERSVKDALREYQSVIIPCESKKAMLATMMQQRVDVVVLKLSKPLDEDFRTLAEVQINAPNAEVIFVAQFDDEMLRDWMEVIQRGAYEFLPKPLDREELGHHLLRATEKHHPVEPRKRLYATSPKNLPAGGT